MDKLVKMLSELLAAQLIEVYDAIGCIDDDGNVSNIKLKCATELLVNSV